MNVTGVDAVLRDPERFRASLMLAWHEDLVALDDELDIRYRGQI